MKRTYKMFIGMAFVAFTATACQENAIEVPWDDDILGSESTEEDDDNGDINVSKYDFLKSYVDRSASPKFHLGAAIDASVYSNGGDFAKLINDNFDQVVATYHMKHDQVVDENGNMDFTAVNKFLDASEAGGIEVFGHTLCWHVGQKTSYLDPIVNKVNKTSVTPVCKLSVARNETTWKELMTDGSCDAKNSDGTFMIAMTPPTGDASNGEYLTEGDNNYLSVTKDFGPTDAWRLQFILALPEAAEAGDEYAVSFKVRSSSGATIPKIMLQTPSPSNGYVTDIEPWSIQTTTDWTTVNFILNVGTYAPGQPGRIVFSMGAVTANETFDFDDVSVRKKEVGGVVTPDPTEFYEVLSNGDFEGDDLNNYYANGKAEGAIKGNAGNPGRAFVVTNATAQAAAWESEMILDTRIVGGMQNGDIYKISFDVKSDQANTQLKLALFNETAGQINAPLSLSAISPTSEWKTYELTLDNTSGQYTGMSRLAFRMGQYAMDAYFDNISVLSNRADDANTGGSGDGGGNGDGTTPEQIHPAKEELLVALEDFIEGMLNTTKGKVSAWDVLNEPLDDNNVKNLKTDGGKTGNADFYWQDYLGKDYARDAVRFARKHGGNNIILFVNEYGLSWSHTDKLGSLIEWIEYWESDGVTKFDGIASQMHISYYANDAKQAIEEAAVVKMLEKMSATGKYVKISELDMQYKDENDKALKASDLSEEQHKEMADYYEFIVSKYFEIVPVNQQYSITHWTPIDPAANAGWRGGEPVGLFNPDFSRKPQYAGFADGLNAE